MHISSLPGEYSCGAFNESAKKFVDFIKECGFSYWQVLPFGIVDECNSPYKSYSAFAGNPYFIDIEALAGKGLITREELDAQRQTTPYSCEYVRLYHNRLNLLREASKRAENKDEILKFIAKNKHLESFCTFMGLKAVNENLPWQEWKNNVPDEEEVFAWKFIQYYFFMQWKEIKEHANSRGIEIIGDIPIYVALDSADVWTNMNYFQLDKDKKPKKVAGCPPDAFCMDGQLWGNPLYDWKALKQSGYVWWIHRIKESRKLYDVIRLDHFRGFESYYAIPSGDKNAKNGVWEKGPGAAFFKAVKKNVPGVRFIAEDLGHLTEEVYDLLDECGFPGMKILQFAFDPYNDNPYLPYNYCENCVAYTGTHDNDTLIGWYANETNKEFIRDYLNVATDEWVPAAMIRTVLSSRAKTAIIPIQDYLGCGRRMNTPSTANEENWSYRITKGALHDGIAYNIAHLTKLYKRA